MRLRTNGNLVNAGELRREIELDGGIFRSSNDTEVLVYTIVKERLKCGSIEEAVMNTMHRIEGAYSLVVMSPRKLIAARDRTASVRCVSACWTTTATFSLPRPALWTRSVQSSSAM